MEHEGPRLDLLSRRLLETPADFLAEPMIGSTGEVDVAAVIWDVLRDRGGDAATLGIDLASLRPKSLTKKQRNALRIMLLGCWLLGDPVFDSMASDLAGFGRFIQETIPLLDRFWPIDHLLADADRREELIRRLLDRMNLRPAGESWEQAMDRLLTLDSIERDRALRDADETEKRNQAIREAMARKAAEEAASRYGE